MCWLNKYYFFLLLQVFFCGKYREINKNKIFIEYKEFGFVIVVVFKLLVIDRNIVYILIMKSVFLKVKVL